MSSTLFYKVKDLKIFGSSEYFANNHKKYRLVYDESETTYIWGEFSFFNKKFDEEDWDLKIEMKCFDSKGTLLCSQDASRTIKSDENIVYIRKGWGNDQGTFWKKGEYRWEAWIDGKKIKSQNFYIVNIGKVTSDHNPYFQLKSVKLYEAGSFDIPKNSRVYLQQFDEKNTRYVWVEFEAENLVKYNVDYWPCELQFNFYSDTGQLKGSINKLLIVYPGDDLISIAVGWGNDKGNHWFKDHYRLEIIFMDELIALIPFSVGDEAIELEGEYTILKSQKPKGIASKPLEEQSLEEVMAEMNELIGLESIKTKIKEYTSYLNFIKIRNEKGIEDPQTFNLHAVFTGNPGTGKTTVARLLGKIYQKIGLLSKGHVVEVDRSDLIGEYIGQTAPKTKEMIRKAKGGILFIDEAYSLARKSEDSKDFGKEAIEILIKEMTSQPDFAVICAGYPDEMKYFLESNPGLKSRFNMVYEFPDYVPQELMQIAEHVAQKRNIVIAPDAKDFLYTKIVDFYRSRDKSFGNARLVYSLMDEAKMNMGLRLMKTPNINALSKEELSTVTLEDFQKIFENKSKKIADIPIDEEFLKGALNELHQMIGMSAVKQEVDELVKLVRFYKEIGKDIRNTFSLHTIFTGNPGTGKTTVARILAKIYKGLGILERGHLVETDRQKLVAMYSGQTAEKTNMMIEQAMGGVLFIDEAYSLYQGPGDSFGKEAIDTLLKRMEDHRGEFVVIVAGYPDNMEYFLNTNPGLKSRFDRTLVFEDYKPEELLEIALDILKKENIKPDQEAKTHLLEYFTKLYEVKDKFFGNGRVVRKTMEKAIKNQHLRLASIPPDQRTPEMISTMILSDVQEFVANDLTTNKGKQIGFKNN